MQPAGKYTAAQETQQHLPCVKRWVLSVDQNTKTVIDVSYHPSEAAKTDRTAARTITCRMFCLTFLHVSALKVHTTIRADEDDVGLAGLEAAERLHQRGHETHAVCPTEGTTVVS